MLSTDTLLELDDPVLREADHEAVLAHAFFQQPLDPAIAARVRERSARSTAEIRRRFGPVAVVVSTLREILDEA